MLWSVWISVASLVGSAGPANEVDRLLSAYYEAYRTGTAEELAGFYTDDVVFDDVSQRHHVEGKAPFTEALAGLKNIHVEMNIEEKRRMVSGESVVVEIFYKGTLDCAKLGRPDHENLSYALPAVLLLEVSNGRDSKADRLHRLPHVHRDFREAAAHASAPPRKIDAGDGDRLERAWEPSPPRIQRWIVKYSATYCAAPSIP